MNFVSESRRLRPGITRALSFVVIIVVIAAGIAAVALTAGPFVGPISSTTSSITTSSSNGNQTLAISPPSGPAGTVIRAIGSGFTSSTEFTICFAANANACFDGYGRAYITAKSDTLGKIIANITVPSSAANDGLDYVIVLAPPGPQGHSALVTVGFTVTSPQRVTVSGKLLPPNKVDLGPDSVVFVNSASGQKYSASVVNAKYSISLPNHASYDVTVNWTQAPGVRSGASSGGSLNLNASSQTCVFDINW